MKNALIGIGTAFGLLAALGAFMWAVELLPTDPVESADHGVVVYGASGWIGFWVFLGLVVAGHDVYIAGNKVADAIRDRREGEDR